MVRFSAASRLSWAVALEISGATRSARDRRRFMDTSLGAVFRSGNQELVRQHDADSD
jgi:hypothetical protein